MECCDDDRVRWRPSVRSVTFTLCLMLISTDITDIIICLNMTVQLKSEPSYLQPLSSPPQHIDTYHSDHSRAWVCRPLRPQLIVIGSKLLISHLNTCHPQTANVTLSHNTVHTTHPATTVEKRSLIKPKVIPQTQQVSTADGAVYVILDQIPSNISSDDTCLPLSYASDCQQINSTDPSQDLGKSIADVNPTQCLQKSSIYYTQSKHTGVPALDHRQSFHCTAEQDRKSVV